MKIYLTTLLLLCLYTATAQEIVGVVIDCDTEEPIPFANVYLEGTYQGESTNASGEFVFYLPTANRGMPLIISSIGYETAVVERPERTNGTRIRICLREKSYELEEVTVSPDEMSRPEKWALFLEAFIGASRNARDCEVLNPDVVQLRWHEREQTLEGWADRPIRIHNRSLGYFIEYELDEFNYTEGRTQYYGHYRFQPDTTLSTKELRQTKRRRRQAYFGSRMHLIRSLFSGETYRSGYRLMDAELSPQTPSALLEEADGFIYLQPTDKLQVWYIGGNHRAQTILVPHQETLILANGYYDARSVQWSGAMSTLRVGDLLPFEYELE